MSKERTETHIHQAKDDLFYPSYESMRDANVRVNSARLEKLGLGAGSSPFTKPKKKKPTKRKAHSPPVTELRRSNRVRMVTPEFNLLPDELIMPRPVKKKRLVSGSRSATLQPHELEALKDMPNWLEGMEEFLLTVPHGSANKVVSRDNMKTVMRQTRRMVGGLGIEYHRWEEGVVWKKGVKIDLSMDFDALFDEAVEFETLHGRDLGNGWLMRHPIRKLHCYQEYLAQTNNNNNEKGDEEETKVEGEEKKVTAVPEND